MKFSGATNRAYSWFGEGSLRWDEIAFANLGVRWVGVAEKIVCLRIKRTWCLHAFTHFPFCDCRCATQVQKTPHIAMFRTFRWFFLVEF